MLPFNHMKAVKLTLNAGDLFKASRSLAFIKHAKAECGALKNSSI